MNARPILLLLLGASTAIGIAYWYQRRAALATPPDAAAPSTTALDDLTDFVADPVGIVSNAVQGWAARGEPYVDVIDAAAARNGVPGDLLMRVAYQECRWRTDIISGQTASPVGALGMFQFMPGTAQDLGVDPLNVASAADGAARYLARNKNKFGTWSLALMAYNWGPGNVSQYLAGTKSPPTETKNYVAQITSDVGYA